MESLNDKHHNSRNNNLYLHTHRRRLCGTSNNEYCYNKPGYSNVRTNWSAVSKQYTAIIANIINQRKKWNMESINDQYFNSGNNNVYFHTDWRWLCNTGYNEYCYNQPGYTNIYTDWTSLSK